MKSSNPQVQAQLGMLEGSKLAIYTKGTQSRTESNMGAFITTINVIDAKKKKGILLMDGMMGKIASPYDLNQADDENDINKAEIQFVDETKEILGYKCKKAIMSMGEEAEFTYWYTEDIKISPEAMGKYVSNKIPGLPLEYTIEQEQVTLNFVATSVENSLKETKGMFDVSVPKGYTVKTMEEISKMGGGL